MRSTAPITTTDLLKVAGLVFVLADHTGLFFAPDDDWWRVAGRAAAPIFFFLIGFARTSAVPLNWIVLGSVLTFLDLYVSEDLEDVTLNILFNFALIRLALPFIDAYVLPRRWGLAALAVFCAAMIPLAAIVLEYGAEGWLWAVFGIAAREAIAKGVPEARLQRNLVAAFCVAVYLFTETRDFEFEATENAALAALIIGLGLTLVFFRRADAFDAPASMARAFNWIGRHSLEIYAVSLFLMQATGSWLEADDGETDPD